MKGIIYKITNKVNNKSYIGQTRYTLLFRWNQHIHCKDKTHFHNALRKYGVENFTAEVLEECDVEILNEREIFYIAKYDTFANGYNSTIGEDGNKTLVLDDKYDEIKRLYLSGFSSNKIATLYKVDKASIVKILKALGVKIRSNKLNINALELLELIRDYQQGCSLRELAKRYDCSGPVLKEFLIRKGVNIAKRYSLLDDEKALLALIDDYLDGTLKLSEILSKYHCDYKVLCKVLSIHGINKGKKHFRLNPEQCLEVIRKFNSGIGVYKLADMYEVDKVTIYSLLKRYNVNYKTV